MPIEALKALYTAVCSRNGSIRTNHGVFWQPLPNPGPEQSPLPTP